MMAIQYTLFTNSGSSMDGDCFGDRNEHVELVLALL